MHPQINENLAENGAWLMHQRTSVVLHRGLYGNIFNLDLRVYIISFKDDDNNYGNLNTGEGIAFPGRLSRYAT
jgi:hypothetical protein